MIEMKTKDIRIDVKETMKDSSKEADKVDNVQTPVSAPAKPSSANIERSLVVLKPDCVQRCLSGRIIQKFEDAGLKIVGMKMMWVTKEFAKKHYFDVEARKGKTVYDNLVSYITEGPVIAMVIEGIAAVETIRKIVGPTEPKSALPGTIRGDFAHHSYGYTDTRNMSIKNLIHASGTVDEAKFEVSLWFKPEELHTYKTVHDVHVL